MGEELKPGQKFPTPTPGFGDRVFYETLRQQRPDSAMAQEWCVHYGVLPHDEARRLEKIVMERRKNARLLGVASSSLSAPAAKKKKKKAKVLKTDAADQDVAMSRGGEGIGRIIL